MCGKAQLIDEHIDDEKNDDGIHKHHDKMTSNHEIPQPLHSIAQGKASDVNDYVYDSSILLRHAARDNCTQEIIIH
jgi:hypothetical protein